MSNIAPRISATPDICHGRAVIAGTRVPVEVVLGQLSAGLSVDRICEEYGVTPEDISAALAYAADTVAQEQLLAI